MTRRLPADQRRAQLLEAALAIAEHSGLGAVTIRGVAERAGVSLGVVHYCYTDKDELIGDVIGAVNADLAAVGEAFLRVDFGTGEPGREMLRSKLREAFDLVWAVISASPHRQLLTYEIVTHSLRAPGSGGPGVARAQYEGYDRIVATVLDGLAEAAGMRWDMDRDRLIRFVMATIDGLALRWQIDRDDDMVHFALRDAIDLLVSSAVPE